VSGVGIPSASGRPNQPDLVLLTDLIEKGMVRPVIERRYMLGDVPDVVRYMEEGHATGKVIVTV
jgi:NADPH:quinone reductase-like Zn-dependent oxidoreductase